MDDSEEFIKAVGSNRLEIYVQIWDGVGMLPVFIAGVRGGCEAMGKTPRAVPS
jgi:hypothetical protein